ncbi:MAG TPA: cytochrome P450 [Acidimicrobiia bacterium]|jgi:cholest-4-en-3-one 26-monooxygenase
MPTSTTTAGPLHDPVTYARGFPHERFRALRDHDAVSHHDHPDFASGYWVVARHADVQRVSRDATTFRNAPHPFLEEAGQDQSATSGLLISLDAPDHVKQRKLINRGFTPRRVSDLTDALVARVNGIIDSLRTRRECDLVHDLALWLPLHVIADLVGVPEEDRERVFRLTERTFGFDPAVSLEERTQAAVEMFAYADALCEERRRHPADDLISALLDAELDGERLDQMQLDLFFMLLQNAGSETTRNLITSGTVALIQAPDQFDRLRGDLSLLPTAIEELLRFTSPVMLFARSAMRDTEIGGQPIAAGERVVMAYPSANRDERAFADPDAVDVARTPNEHVAFGAGGPHYCLGASLARLEAKVMFEAIATRFQGLALEGDPADFPRLHSTIIDGFAEVPIHWQAIDE